MIDISVYRLVHFLGIMMLFLSLGGLLLHTANGWDKAENRWRRGATLTHGIGLLLVLLGGFGMIARLGITWPWPGWVLVKMGIWVVFGGVIALAYRSPSLGKTLWFALLLLGLLAAYMAGMKPF